MKFRKLLAWLLLIPSVLLLLGFVVALPAVVFLPVFEGNRLFLFAGSFLYLLIAQLLLAGSHLACPAIYQTRLGWLSGAFLPLRALIVWGFIYAMVFSYVSYIIYFVHATRPQP